MTKLVDAIVVGGGIHGCSTALHLCCVSMGEQTRNILGKIAGYQKRGGS
jgi:hypothetical protein